MQVITLKRDVEAVQIPYGQKMVLTGGSEVTIYQVLGGNYTVQTDQGMLARVDGKDADALGVPNEPPKPAAAPPPAPANATLDQVVNSVWGELRKCYDPEIPVNIVELGLIYECKVAPEPAGGFGVDIQMTLTAPGCGMGPVLQADVQGKVQAIPGVARTNIDLVLDPPWDPTMMTEAARLELGML